MKCFHCIFHLVELSIIFAYDDLSYNKSTTQSPIYPGQNYAARYAVDRNTASCMRTNDIGGNSPCSTTWWKVDLSGIFNIYSINILFKNYDGEEDRQRGRFAGFSLYISTSGNIEDSTLCYKNGHEVPPLNFTVTCSLYGRYVIFYNERLRNVTYPSGYEPYNVFTDLCEVIVQGCQSGVYGSYCAIPCPANCEDNTCHIQDGKCFTCEPGWSEMFCNTKCREGWYGINCSEQCIGHCRGSTTCNHVTGWCDEGCETGWTGYMCNKGCIDGTFGYDCINSCSGHCLNNSPCNKQTGQCDGRCNLGYTNSDCSKECPTGSFGLHCRELCSGHCINNESCHHIFGICRNGCQDGYMGIRCNKSCKEGYYGTNCSQVCHFTCQTCRHTDGLCTCKAGWRGYNCTTASQQNAEPYKDTIACTPWIIAFSIALVFGIIFIVATFKLWRASNQRNSKEGCIQSAPDEKNDAFSDGVAHYQELSVSKEHNNYETIALE